MPAVALTPALGQDIAERFALLADTWERETRFFSDNERILTHPAYQQIIGMGPFALPFILNRLRKRGGHWSWALICITGEDPVDPAHAGDIHLMRKAWLRWAAAREP